MDSEIPPNQAGGVGAQKPDVAAGVGAKVLHFPGGRGALREDSAEEWYGPRDELVRLGGRSETAPEAEETGDEDGSAAPSGVAAEDFWEGLADAGDLVQFPAEPRNAEPEPAHHRRRVRVTWVAAILVMTVIGVRVWALPGGHSTGSAGTKQAALSRHSGSSASGSAVDQQQTRRVYLHAPTSGSTRRPAKHASHGSRASHRVLAHQSPSSQGQSQPVVYSRPATPPPASTPSSGSTGGDGSGSDGGGSSGGGGSANGHSGGGSKPAGPSGPGATFGPGKVGG